MLRLDNNLNIEMIKGDNGGLEFFLTCYDFKETDTIEFVCYKGAQEFFRKSPVMIKDGMGYFYIESSESKNIPLGTHNYDIIININEFNRNETILNKKNFTILEGVNYA